MMTTYATKGPGCSSIESLEYQSGMLPHFVKPYGFPAFLGHAQFRPIGGQKSWCGDDIIGDPVRVGIDEPFKFARVVRSDPARQLVLGGCKSGIYAIFMLEAVCYYLELQSAHRAQQQSAPPVRTEHLNRTLLTKLCEPQFKLLATHRVGNLDRLEKFRREKRQACKLQPLAFCQCITQLQCPMIGNSDDIAGIGNIEQIPPLGEKRDDAVGSDILIVTYDPQVHAAFEPA